MHTLSLIEIDDVVVRSVYSIMHTQSLIDIDDVVIRGVHSIMHTTGKAIGKAIRKSYRKNIGLYIHRSQSSSLSSILGELIPVSSQPSIWTAGTLVGIYREK